MPTFAHDSALPHLPLPELAASCAALPELIAPLVDASTLAATLLRIEDFSRSGGEGERLQNALAERVAALPGNASWLRPFLDEMYRSYRGSLPLNMNYAFRFNARRWGGGAALPHFVLALAEVLARLEREDIDPELVGGAALSMDQAKSCVYTRMAGHNADTLVPVKVDGFCHVAVVCQGHWFVVPLRRPDGAFLCVEALAQTFARIRKEASVLPEPSWVGAMTTAPREEAAALRAALQSALQNRLSLAALERSLFVVCLDPPAASDDAAFRALLCGDAANRFFDKSVQVIAPENGSPGANFEHSGCDAAIWVYLLSLADARIRESSDDDESGQAGAREPALYRLLRWDIPETAALRLGALRKDFAATEASLDLTCRDFADFSRERLQGLGTSPDAFLQTAFQVAQHAIFGKMRSSCEAIAVRGFAQGRTEVARGGSGEALAFALALHRGSPDKKLLELYRQAERTHKSRMQRCQRGLGIERHMYGLEVMYRLYGKSLGMDGEPALFRDQGWLTLKHDALSTSGIGAPFIRWFGFGPARKDGFGIGYSANDTSTGLVLTSYRESGFSVAEFAETFAGTSARLARILEEGKAAG